MTGILVVDDDRDIRESLQLALELEGYEVTTACDGEEAWSALRTGPRPALVVLDLAMPVLDGPGLLARVRRDPWLRSLAVVIVTAFGARAAEACEDAQGWLPKPVDLDRLLAMVARHARSPDVARLG